MDIKILYFLRDKYPTFRVDINVLFGKYLPRHKIFSTLVAIPSQKEFSTRKNNVWQNYQVIIPDKFQKRGSLYHFKQLLHDWNVLRNRTNNFDVIQVRNKIITGLIAIYYAKRFKKPFYYWMSFPYPEDDLLRVRTYGFKLGYCRFIFTLCRGLLTKLLLYKIVLQYADYVFVQSSKMKYDLLKYGIATDKMTPIPMGIDFEEIKVISKKFQNKKTSEIHTIIYLGALDKTRRIEFFFDVLKELLKKIPNVKLLLIGDAIEPDDITYLISKAKKSGVWGNVKITGWLPMEKAWEYMYSANVGVCAIPRNSVFDSMSPTKAVEYMAHGVPVVVNDHPDQADLIKESGGGLCVNYDSKAFADAIRKIISNPKLAKEMSKNGVEYIRRHRSYEYISSMLAKKYKDLL